VRIKKYEAETVTEALAQVKKEMGPDAFILSTKKITRRGRFGFGTRTVYEMVAAVEPEEMKSQGARGPGSKGAREMGRWEDEEPGSKDTSSADRWKAEFGVQSPDYSDESSGPKREFQTSAPIYSRAHTLQHPYASAPQRLSAPASPHNPEIARLQEEMRLMRQTIESLIQNSRRAVIAPQNGPLDLSDLCLDSNLSQGIFESPFNELYQDFIETGVERTIAFSLVKSTQEGLGAQPSDAPSLTEQVKNALAQLIELPSDDELLDDEPRVAAFIGPTGVGKTTTIAKIAARNVLKKRRKVVLVTLDTYRIAAVEQLKIYAEIIGAPVEVVASVSLLDETVRKYAGKALVLIDTAGKSHNELAGLASLASYLKDSQFIRKYLVLSANTKPADTAEIITNFNAFGPDCLIFTKLDETRTAGSILNELVRTRKPLAYLAVGQKVPEDLQVATLGRIAELVLPAPAYIN